jgi:hypothetical protein
MGPGSQALMLLSGCPSLFHQLMATSPQVSAWMAPSRPILLHTPFHTHTTVTLVRCAPQSYRLSMALSLANLGP